ncbi:MAG TPA: hypothetical protein VKT75_03765 [Acidobacteriaceae bacterium]|nr:hypothetical protein [Acidobacteriaceae bacterium]
MAFDTTPVPHFLLDAQPYHEPWTITRAELATMPRTSIVIRDSSDKRKRTYGGVRMYNLLERAGAPLGKELYGVALQTSIVASGYVPGMKQTVEVVYALAEFDPTSKCGEFILADTVDGHPIDPDEGPFVLISAADKTRKRWVPGLQWMMFHPGLEQPVRPGSE